jgi:hypothetical protein
MISIRILSIFIPNNIYWSSTFQSQARWSTPPDASWLVWGGALLFPCLVQSYYGGVSPQTEQQGLLVRLPADLYMS